MDDGPHIVLSLIGTVGVSTFLITWWMAANRPVVIHRKWTEESNFWQILWMIFTFIGTSTTFYITVHSVLFWIPSSIGTTNEDGNWQPMRQLIAAICAIIVGIYSIKWIFDSAKRDVDATGLYQESKDLREKLNKTITPKPSTKNDMVPAQVAVDSRVTGIICGIETPKNSNGMSTPDSARSNVKLEKHIHTLGKMIKEETIRERRKKELRYIPTCTGLPTAAGLEMLLSQESYKKVYNRCHEKSVEVLEKLRKNLQGDTSSSIRLLDLGVEGIRISGSDWINLDYRGDSHGGRTEFTVTLSGKRIELQQAITIDNSAEGMVSAFFLVWQLPTLGAFWHGLYDLPTIFYFSDDRLYDTLLNKEEFRGDEQILAQILSIPTGIRISKVADRIIISCLSYIENNAIVDCWIEINNLGKITYADHKLILKSNLTMLY